jgi:SOS-response transcriptional repressor LexA
MNAPELSSRQLELLLFYIKHIEEHGYQPTYREAATHFGITSRAIQDRLLQLARKGYCEMPVKRGDRCVRFPHLRFEHHFVSEPTPPEIVDEPHPQTGEIIRLALQTFFFNNDNEPAKVATMAETIGAAIPKVYAALNHDKEGIFRKVKGPGRAILWQLRTGAKDARV